MPRTSRKRSPAHPAPSEAGAPRPSLAPPAPPPPVPGTWPATADRPRPSSARRALGAYGENLAVRRLVAAGMLVLARNWRCREGEIDIVALDGDALVICEVKTRRAGAYEDPMAAIGQAKAERLRRLAARWLERYGGPPAGGVRIDVVGVRLPDRGAPAVEHVRGVS
ncbi:YraN family protein [Streptomyces buecherae]|nr:YraN family protein [Streptomyces buecherae]